MKPSTSHPSDDSRNPRTQPSPPSSTPSQDYNAKRKVALPPRAPALPNASRPALQARPQLSSRQHVISPLAQQPSNVSPPTASRHASQSPIAGSAKRDVGDGAISPGTKPPVLGKSNASPQPSSGISRPNRPRFLQDDGISPPIPAETSSKQRSTPIEAKPSSVSPSLRAAFESPPPTDPTPSSTESAESVKTVRAFASATPAASTVRTPSYPFPYVLPPNSRKWSGPIHQPFTNLSPTTQSPSATVDYGTMRDRYESISSTPGDSASFNPLPYAPQLEGDDDRFPTPNLFDLVLRINAEPTLEAWWDQLVSIAQQWYKADRAQLSLPADSTDIENVPWGLKAAWNAHGLKRKPDTACSSDRSNSISSNASRDSSSKKTSKASQQTSPVTTKQPRLSRQSFAGRDSEAAEATASATFSGRRNVSSHGTKFNASRRTSSDRTPQIPSRQDQSRIIPDNDLALTEGSSADQSMSGIFSILQPLEYEAETLLDTISVNRILDRNKVVVLTREYVVPPEGFRSSDEVPHARKELDTPNTDRPTEEFQAGFGRAGYFKGHSDAIAPSRFHYEEYEQAPTSPWAQSPAPSPAVQADPEENPFFASDNFEASFSPGTAKEDYSGYGAVEAIGVDRAATIIHLPLIHPFHSWTMGASGTDVDGASSSGQTSGTQVDNVLESRERKAPLAILTLYTRTVPFPRNLQDSLKHFSPHLANSLNTALQMHVMQHQIMSRQNALSKSISPSVGVATGLGVGLDDLLRSETEDASSSTTLGSIASPSDYSGRSRPSPGGSFLGTPGLEFATGPSPMRQASRAPTPGTAPIMEPSDSYFEPKQRVALSRSKSTHVVSHVGQKASTSPRSSGDHRGMLGRIDEPSSTRSKEGKNSSSVDAKPSASRSEELWEPKMEEPKSSTDDAQRRSLLHSYGADFAASFQLLPAATGLYHGRSMSTSDAQEMPPPSERLLRTIIDALPVQIFTAAPRDGRITWVNSKFLVYRGHGAKEVLDSPWQAVHPHDTDDYLAAWRRCLESGTQFQRKLRIRRFDGVYRWFYVRAAPLRDKKQNIVHWIGTYVDFHDQHIAESNSAKQQETAASEAKYRALANSSPQIVFAATRSRGIIFCNTKWLEYSGQTEDTALKVGFLEMVHPDDIVKCKLPIFEGFDGGAPDVPVSMPPANLHRSTSGLSSEVGSEASGESNVTLMRFSASSPAEMPQRKLSELATKGILKISRDSSGKPSYSTEVRLRNKSGEYRWHLVRVLLAEPVISEENEEETWYGSCADINDHKELEAQLKETMDAKSRFLSNMSHEIRTPLHGIHGMTNMLMDTRLTEEQMDQVNTIRASTEGLRDLINDILDLSKVEAGMIVLNMDWLNLRSIIEEVDDLTAALATDKGIELNYIIEDDVPRITKGDRFRIRQVLLNVIGNAIKFTERGEVLVRCQRAVPSEPAAPNSMVVRFSIHDTGKGFTDKEAERLFKRFSQIDGSSTRQHGGSGLGLVISMQLVELHGGVMTANSVPGRGSVFSFTVEVGVPTAQEAQQLARSDAAALARIAGEEPPILKSGIASSSLAMGEELYRPASPQMLLEPLERPLVRFPGISDLTGADPSPIRESLPGLSPASPTAISPEAVEYTTPNPAYAELINPGMSSTRPTPIATPSEPGRRRSVIRAAPLLFNVLLVANLQWSREATVKHLESVLAQGVPHHITAVDSLEEGLRILRPNEQKIVFSHIVVAFSETDQLISLITATFNNPALAKTSIVAISSLSQKKEVMHRMPSRNYDALARDGQLLFVFKPLKPSKLVPVFDPHRSHSLSSDRSQHAVAVETQRQLFNEMTERLGNRDIRVLVVEDNLVNQKVSGHNRVRRCLTLTMLAAPDEASPTGIAGIRHCGRRGRVSEALSLEAPGVLLHHPSTSPL